MSLPSGVLRAVMIARTFWKGGVLQCPLGDRRQEHDAVPAQA
jgi:hypothetical protein